MSVIVKKILEKLAKPKGKPKGKPNPKPKFKQKIEYVKSIPGKNTKKELISFLLMLQ